MRASMHTERNLDFASLAGLAAGLGGLLIAAAVPGMELMALPALAILVPSLLIGTR